MVELILVLLTKGFSLKDIIVHLLKGRALESKYAEN